MSTEALPADASEVDAVGLVAVGSYAGYREGFERGLVVLALGAPFWLEPEHGRYRLLVEPGAAVQVRRHLAAFEREALARPAPRPPAPPPVPIGAFWRLVPLLWALLLLGSYWAQQIWPAWTVAAAVDRSAILQQGEIWRLATALFLHADGGHLISNGIAGIFVFGGVLSTFGGRRGTLLLVLASIAGNFASVLLHGAEMYRSLGASTLIFAGIGLLTGQAAVSPTAAERPALWVPLAAGLAIVGLFGGGAPPVDLTAHVTGFVAGCAAAWMYALTLRVRRGRRFPSRTGCARV